MFNDTVCAMTIHVLTFDVVVVVLFDCLHLAYIHLS